MKVKRVFKRVLALVTAAVLLAAGAGNAAALNISVSNTVMLTPAGGGVGVVYESFSGAMTAANSGDKLKLLADISLTNYATTKDGVEIVVPSGKTLTITYNQSCSLFESDITVESGGTVAFKISKATASNVYLVMNGDLELKEGATAKMTERVKPISVSGSFQASGVIFNGGYKNSGTLTTSSSNTNGSPFIKWGTPAGNVTGGYAVYNLCRTTPSEKTINNSELYVSRINGTIAVGETVSAELDGFGDSAELPTDVKPYWYKGSVYSSSDRGQTYTIKATDVGKTIGATWGSIGDTSSAPSATFPYVYMFESNGAVTRIVNYSRTAVYADEAVPAPDVEKVYLGGEGASDENSGLSDSQALASLEQAVATVNDGGTIVVCGELELPEDDYTYIQKSVTLTARDGDTTYENAVVSGTTDDNGTSGVCLKGRSLTLTFKDITLDGYIELLSYYDPNAKFVFDGVTLGESSEVFAYASASYSINGFFPVFNIDVKNSDDFLFSPYNETDEEYFNICLDNSVVCLWGNGSAAANITLKNESYLDADITINNLTAEGAGNTLGTMYNYETKYAVPISIEGTITASDKMNLSISGELYPGMTILSSTGDNTSLTADVFNVTRAGVSLKKKGYSLTAVLDEFSLKYEGGKLTAKIPVSGTYTAVFAEYDGGKLVKSASKEITVSTLEAAGGGEIEITAPEGFTLSAGTKVMLWKSLDNLMPMATSQQGF